MNEENGGGLSKGGPGRVTEVQALSEVSRLGPWETVLHIWEARLFWGGCVDLNQPRRDTTPTPKKFVLVDFGRHIHPEKHVRAPQMTLISQATRTSLEGPECCSHSLSRYIVKQRRKVSSVYLAVWEVLLGKPSSLNLRRKRAGNVLVCAAKRFSNPWPQQHFAITNMFINHFL